MINSVHRFLCSLSHDYRISLVRGVLDPDSAALAGALGGRRALVVTTPSVYDHYGSRLVRLVRAQQLDVACEVLELREQQKNLVSVERICELALRYKLGRSDVLIALGGGVCSDTVSLAASLIRRGIPHIRIPTTLIGQIDAAIGVKGGVNFGGQKNYVGCFHPPAAVLVDPLLLSTLDRKALSHGFAEIVKIALICDAELLRDVQRHGHSLLSSGLREPLGAALRIIDRSIALMLKELDENPYENVSAERLVDMGHTFSPYLEAASGFTIPHGDAVSIDMALTSLISTELGMLAERDAQAIIGLLYELGLPIWSPLLTQKLCSAAADQMVLQRRGDLNLVALRSIGQPIFVKRRSTIDGELLARAIDKLAAIHYSMEPNLSSSSMSNS